MDEHGGPRGRDDEFPVAVRGYFVPDVNSPAVDRIRIRDLATVLWGNRWIIVVAIVLFSTGALGLALWSKPVYRSIAVAKIAESTDSGGGALADIARRFGGFAAVAGIQSLAVGSRTEALAVLRSNALVEEFINANSLLPALFPERWDATTGTWRTGDPPPSLQRGIRRFSRGILDIDEDKLTGLVRVTIRWDTPETAASWANQFIERANDRVRRRTVEEAAQSLEFLETELGRTNNVVLQQVIGQLMQEQLNSMTLAKVRRDFALKVIDPAKAPDRDDYVWPRPALLAAFGAFFGFLVGAVIALVISKTRATALEPTA